MSDYCVRIECLQNGFEVELKDPGIVKANAKKGVSTPWRDPWVSFAFTTSEEVLAFLKANLDKALPGDEYSSSFDLAVAEDDDEGDE